MTRTWTATFHVSPARHGASSRDLLAHLEGQRVTVQGPSRLLGQTVITDTDGRRGWTVLDSELTSHRQHA